MNGQPGLAIADAHQIIKYSPVSAEGYLRKANTFVLYGNQLQAIEAYDEGLRNATAFGGDQQMYIKQLEKGRKEAIKQKSYKVIDFIIKLPIEPVGHTIIPLLPLSTRSVCLTVSKAWREILLDCSHVWENLSVIDNNRETLRLFALAPCIGRHVKYLVISTQVDIVHKTLFQFMKNGYYNKIELLKIKGIASLLFN